MSTSPLLAGHVAGESAQDVKNLLRRHGDHFVNEVAFKPGTQTNSLTRKRQWVAPFDFEIVDVYAVESDVAAADSATAALAIDPAGDNKNPLASASIDIDALTLDTPTKQTLSATEANRQGKKGDVLEATFVTDGSGTIQEAQLIVHVKPIG